MPRALWQQLAKQVFIVRLYCSPARSSYFTITEPVDPLHHWKAASGSSSVHGAAARGAGGRSGQPKRHHEMGVRRSAGPIKSRATYRKFNYHGRGGEHTQRSLS